jgi:hypothetical protein
VFSGLKRFVLWDFPRASWQYDVMVGLILLFIFLTPRAWFKDSPRIPKASEIVLLPGTHDGEVFWIEPELVTPIPENERLARVGDILRSTFHRPATVTRLEPIYDSEQGVEGYMAFAKP